MADDDITREDEMNMYDDMDMDESGTGMHEGKKEEDDTPL